MITGVDIPISLIRDDFAAGLWTSVSNRIFYSRAFRNEKLIGEDIQVIPEVFTANKEYKEVLFDNKWNVSVFFDVSNERTNIREKPTTVISAIFAVNLNAIYPGVAYRQEENVHADVLQIFNATTSSYRITSIDIITGIDAYGDFFRDNVKGFNMQPWHTFRLDLGIQYFYDCNDTAFNRGAANDYPDPVIF
ncbi:MAG: hypothetical protein IID16_01055 [Candidatus Marinimicrobia bacterium]|nr:hypothetical protein [Candidatus Neomarinimicrobiota bacterium]